MTQYEDIAWIGSKASMAAALASLVLISDVKGVVVTEATDITGAPATVALIRVEAGTVLTLPAGVQLAPEWVSNALVGQIASLGPRVVSAAAFLGRFTPTETAALWSADPRLMAGAMKVLAQGSANLDSVEAAQIIGLAVARGVLTQARAAEVLA